MKRIICMLAATAALAAAAKSFEDSPLFVKRVDPYSGVVSYILKTKAHAFNQQGIYFTNKSVTDDGRFLLFSVTDNPQDRKKRVTVANLEKETSTELPLRKPHILFLDTATDQVYWFDEAGLHRVDLLSDVRKDVITCPYPAELKGVKLGLLDADLFGPAARKAHLALVRKFGAHANLADVCEGTVKKNGRDHYLARPRVNGAPYGQAALMWICNALLESQAGGKVPEATSAT